MPEGPRIAPRPRAQNRLRKTLWLCALSWLLFLCTLLAGNSFIPEQKAITRAGVGHDFLAFYTAGHFLRTSRYADLYNLDSVRSFQSATARAAGLEWDDSPGMLAPFWNPPFYAFLFAPLSSLAFQSALITWWIINALCLLAALCILTSFLPQTARPGDKLLLALIVILSMPAIQAFTHAQNSYTSLLLVSATVYLWRKAALTRGNSLAFLAGVICGLLAYKPQLGTLLGAIMALTLGWRTLLGGLATVSLLLLSSLIFTPGLLTLYLESIGPNLHWMQAEQSYLWERHATLKAFWRLLLQHHTIGEDAPAVLALWALSATGLAAALISLVYRLHRRSPAISPSPGTPGEGRGEGFLKGSFNDTARQLHRLIAATILSMPLLMPFYFDYDLLLLAVPATLLAGDLLTGLSQRKRDRWLVAAWFVLYGALVISPLVSGKLRVHVGVIALTVVALMHVARACRRDSRGEACLALGSMPRAGHAPPLHV